jgi:hyperosmotically inducible periplasmic protein
MVPRARKPHIHIREGCPAQETPAVGSTDLERAPRIEETSSAWPRQKEFIFRNAEKEFEMHIKRCLLAAGASLLFAGSLLAGPIPQEQQPDNSKTNQGDASKGAMTAQQQKMNPADRETTKQIRSSLLKDKSLSTYAHNVKIITRDGRVTLKGPVRSADEKATVAAKAEAIAGADNVKDELTIAPAKNQ